MILPNHVLSEHVPSTLKSLKVRSPIFTMFSWRRITSPILQKRKPSLWASDSRPLMLNLLYYLKAIKRKKNRAYQWIFKKSKWNRVSRVYCTLKIPLLLKKKRVKYENSVEQFSSVAQSCPTLCDPMNRSTPDLPVHHQHPEFTQTHVHRVSDAIQPSHPLSSPSPPAPNPSHYWFISYKVISKACKCLLVSIFKKSLETHKIIHLSMSKVPCRHASHTQALWRLEKPTCYYFWYDSLMKYTLMLKWKNLFFRKWTYCSTVCIFIQSTLTLFI